MIDVKSMLIFSVFFAFAITLLLLPAIKVSGETSRQEEEQELKRELERRNKK